MTDTTINPESPYQVEVTRSISVTVTVSADSAEAALEQVSRRDFPLPPRDEWDGHKDWEYTVYDADGGELVSTWDGGACGYLGAPDAEYKRTEPHTLPAMNRYSAEFTPEAWIRDQAIEVDPGGPVEWDCTKFALEHPGYLARVLLEWGDGFGGTDNDDLFKADPDAPEWIRDWTGPFTIHITKH